jgi:Nif-specific regulatory protein
MISSPAPATLAPPASARAPATGTQARVSPAIDSRRTLQAPDGIELATLYEISKILSSSLHLPSTLREVLSVLSSYLSLARGMISLSCNGGPLTPIAALGMGAAELENLSFADGRGATPRIFRTGMPIVVPDIAQEPAFVNRHTARPADGRRIAFLGVPIRCGRDTIGVLSVDREHQIGTTRLWRDLRVLQMAGNLIGQTARLAHTVQQERQELQSQARRLQKELAGKYKLDNVIGTSKLMQEVFAEVHQAAAGRTTVLLRGESGTGKEVIARAIHFLSPRKEQPFIKVNCAALSETLLESELFGHERGAFTGAVGDRKGRFEQADGGTLFLDEIGDISPAFQAKLLRVLQEREFERVGGSKSIKVNVRLICATNRDLEKAVAAGQFRADLYYRINVVPIFLPALRERPEDIPRLVEHFLDKFNQENERRLKISPEALKVLTGCYWPGNVRELQNCVERAATMTRGDLIRDTAFPCQQNRCLTQMLHKPLVGGRPVALPMVEAKEIAPPPANDAEIALPRVPSAPPPARDEASAIADEPDGRTRLIRAMEQCGWVQAKAARLLGLTPRQVGYALQKYGVEVKKL